MLETVQINETDAMDVPKNYMLFDEPLFSDDDANMGDNSSGDECSDMGQDTRYVCPRGRWIERNYEELENTYLAVKGYLEHWKYGLLDKMDFADFCNFAYSNSRV